MSGAAGTAHVIETPDALLDALVRQGWRVIAPTEVDGAFMTAPIASSADLPRGRIEDMEAGRCRLVDGNPARWFDHVVGPGGWKEWLFPARERLWRAERDRASNGDGFSLRQEEAAWPKTAFFGIRPCDLAAIARQDRVFGAGCGEPGYLARRSDTIFVAVQCARAAPTCFCASMDTGPRAEAGFDLALTELDGRFLLEVGSAAGAVIVAEIAAPAASAADRAEAADVSRATAAMQTRRMASDIAATLAANPEHPHWDDVAARCLACANCTLACPTCFCSDVEDVTDLSGDHAERWRHWDSCFSLDFSIVHDGSVRASTRSRYRQWMTHKLSSWHDQFGESGCVGCGRCIAWCPVGIDITREARAISGQEATSGEEPTP